MNYQTFIIDIIGYYLHMSDIVCSLHSMENSTGRIYELEEAKRLSLERGNLFAENFTKIQDGEMTEKQKQTKQVSKHDNKSKLGKKFTSARYQRNYSFKSK